MIKKITFIGVMAVLCLNFSVIAQTPKATIAELKVGNKLPENFWKQAHFIYQNGKTTVQTLAKYKGKLLIFDFWASWCGTCINKFDHTQALQAEFAKDAAFILVNTKNTRDGEQQIDDLFSGRKYKGKSWDLTTIYFDTYIDKLFPHGYMPYYVLISPSAEVRAIVPAELVTTDNISLMLSAYGKRTGKGVGR